MRSATPGSAFLYRQPELVVDETVEQRSKLYLDGRRLQADHRAADPFGLNPSSFTARTMPTESGGYEQTTTRSRLAAAIARTIGAKSVVAGG